MDALSFSTSNRVSYSLKISLFPFLFLFLSCADLSYLWRASKGQLDLILKKVPLEKALKTYPFTEEEETKIKLVAEIKKYAKTDLKMNIDDQIYSSYVELDQPYVTYLLRVSSAYELKPYLWTFPVTGAVPYKGFFSKEEALKEAKSFPKEKYDVFVRGVTAYSTLGWFEDSILSSMLRYEETNFTTMIFHELAHTVLFFKGHIDFNERFAEFVARQATLSFYQNREGAHLKKVQSLINNWRDELIFSSFMVDEYEKLNQWYKENKGHITAEQKENRIKEIQNRFLQNIQNQLSTNHYDYFPKIELNNARLLSYRSYNFKMDEFEKLFHSPKINKNIKAFIDFCFQFQSSPDPEKALSLFLKEQEAREKIQFILDTNI